MSFFTYLFLTVLAVTVTLQSWLGLRHLRYVRAHRGQVPEAFRDRISLDTHQKAADYCVARTRLGMVDAVYGGLLLLGWTLGGGLELLDGAWRGAGLGPITIGTGVLLSALLITSLLELPFSAYRTFGIEQRFGFNRTTAATFMGDLLKGGLLLVALGGPLAWLVLWIMDISGPEWWLYVWLVWFGFSLLMMWAYPAFIAPLFNRFEPLQDEALRQRIERLLHQCGFQSDGIFVMDGSRRSAHGNAYFTGLGSNKRIVFFDTLVRQLEAEEIEAVLAHELGHFRLHHVAKRLVWLGLISLLGLAVLGWVIGEPWFYAGLGVDTPSDHAALLLFVWLAPLFGFLLTPALSALSRRQEFEADEYAVRHRDSDTLVRALVKLYQENASTLTPDPLYSRFYDSHPPAPIRIRHLRAPPAARTSA
ncbi:MAG: M48 family metallopeptidase [Gammaproteobacteria bacterium]|nr:M48 family metallopeptidase [Gammaproteobacteria bacterium]NIR97872.1 M48 family metallopeptidase [Gammaproteobacteria bacterium]NIT63577.1 M48 family metallopeptidase [Gammaproteobacteria bacterium]NIV20513.1 M48 family metalloprotease [Gammaproteobacteria bacterium]NIX11107.1 M48 family metalloprotease [Gammaproteobacteria bacterium]